MRQSICIFRTECVAVQAIEALQHKEYPLSHISVIAQQEEQIENMEQQLGAEITALSASVVKDQAATGSVLGAVAGGMTGAVLAALSGIGLILAAGPIATALGSAGSLIGAMIGLQDIEESIQPYLAEIQKGHILLRIEATKGKRQEVGHLFSKYGACYQRSPHT
ncbi:hypothetical protein CN345_11360 [Bacillus thuringiensis]|uniref:general stress protein n=1 Tax=Bacillus thuringiensis TaxID=1428 RepID=UPI000BF9DF83|nr:general stress protein [Bacillus thuringiensis]PES04592.1 hypothetical protein CN488_30455 [Bacillus anthracis]PEZ36426.1 hypothetical protein CN345_11360 [Bacillus thuringiensis]PGY49218.1 hypothetical protein COE09_21040 [Bacillus thuringiensis]